jgi:PAS domain S-box-containing protein
VSSVDRSTSPSEPSFLRGDGETTALIRSFDWSATPLGPIDQWPQSLKTATALLLRAPVPIVMLWGPQGVMIYNDAYSVFAGGRHPQLLGSNVREGWPEVADFNDNVMKVGLAGGTLAYKDQELTLHRTGQPEQVWMNLDYWPVPDESGAPAGVICTVVETTQQVKADAALRESEARFRNMADNTPMMMWVTDPTGFCTYLNARWYEFTGQTPAEAEGYGWLDATHPDDKARVEEAFVAANAARAPFGAEYRLRRADGVYRWAIDEASPRFDGAGEYLGYVGSVIDIDERREMEDALRTSEASLRELNADLERQIIERTQARGLTWQVSPDLLGALNSEGYFETSNPAWLTTLGWTEAEVASMSIFELLHPDDVERTQAGFDLTQQGQPAIRFPNRYRHKQGGYRWISWVGVPEDGMVYCSGRDITEEKAQEAERDRLWTLSADMLARADYAGDMSAVNPAWTKILGWTERELLTNPYADIINPEDIPATLAALTQMGETGRPTRFENRILSKDGVWKPIDWTVAPEPDGENFIAVGRDLTSDKAREAQLTEAQDALRQAQKMEAVGQLTGGIAHDFNNLLAGISGSLELLEKRLGEGRLSGVDRYIEVAQSSTRRAAALTQRLLAFSRRQTLDPKPTDINRLIAGMEELIRRSVGPQIALEVVGAGGLWLTKVDPSQLENALLNLTINARDAMPDGGRITIETANKWLDQRAAGDRDLPPGQYVSLCVTDTGTGMSPGVIERAFDPFFTTKPLGQGTGLGLSMIHGFARQSGGQVRIYSEVGSGTTMCLYFPRFVGELESVEAPDACAGAEDGHGETVLVIDDEEGIRVLVADVLEEAGYRVLTAPDGPAGLKVLQTDVRIDLLITDVGLPGGVNGRQVADAARITRPELKVLFITGYAENAVVGNGHLDAGMQVITKPFAMSALGARVREIIES